MSNAIAPDTSDISIRLSRASEHADELKIKSMRVPAFAGLCRGTVGELFQGPAGRSMDKIAIVSALIPRYSRVFFTPSDEIASPSLGHTKAFRALEIYCQHHALPVPRGHWSFISELETSRGMASSTADIVAMIRCAARFFNRTVTIEELQLILSKIERSDSVFMDEFVMYCSSHQQILKYFGSISPLYALYFHEEKKVETENTKELLLSHYSRYQQKYSALYENVIDAFSRNSIADICRFSTVSAELSQYVIPKNSYERIHANVNSFDAKGIITAHTGSLIGYLFSERPSIQLIEDVSLFFSQLGGRCQFTEICP